jgi:hypothetical protein
MRMPDSTWPVGAGIAAMTLMLGLAGCGAAGGGASTVPGTTTTTLAPMGTPAPPLPPPNVGIWLESTPLTGLWPQQRKGPCIVTDIQPERGVFRVSPAPTSIQWTIYNKCSGTHFVRIAYKGPTNPFRACAGRPEISASVPFQLPSGPVPAVDVTCTLVSDACTHFAVDVDSFPSRRPQSCLLSSGQMEIEPW